MARTLRYVPERGSVVEVTVRTHQSQLLLRPSPTLNEIVGGVLGRAQDKVPVRCHAAVVLGNHYHLLLSVEDAKELSDFMRYLNTNLALEINRLHRRRGAVWGGRYRAILVSNEEKAQVGRLQYLLAHGVKEGLVAHAREWPGIHCVREILAGEPIRGLWFDRTQEYAARNRGEELSRLKYASAESFELTPLPCWAHLPAEAYRQQVAALVEQVEIEAAAELAKRGRGPLGVAGVLRQSPETRPIRSKRSPAPLYHAATRAVRKAFWEAYCLFVSAFRDASERLRAGDRMARFPLGSFPPGLPFVTADAIGPPL
ncbi:MAG: transposase [Acidobacteriota bacterium]